jgi:hypothetical protein
MMSLSTQDIENLEKMGYSREQISDAINEVEQEELGSSYKNTNTYKRVDPRQGSQVSSFNSRVEENIARWQLQLDDILERAEHILKGDVPTFENGFVVWHPNPNPGENCFNNIGIQELMKSLTMYVTRNTILGDYTNDEIHIKVHDFARELNNLIFMRYEDFGMDTEEKRKSYPMIVKEMEDIVHATYQRALNGSEKRSLREMVQVLQSTSTNATMGQGTGVTINNQGLPQKERGLLNPFRYVKGRYM